MAAIAIPDKLVETLVAAKSVALLTGAGVSAESGIPTFRSAGGLWRNFRPEELATPEAFARHPNVVWDWYLHRRDAANRAVPNPGHCELAWWERHFPKFALITQNVDGLHHRAGSACVHELHGNIMRSRCHQCGAAMGESAPAGSGPIPRCPCGGLARPDVVWFGEPLPGKTLEFAEDAAHKADVFFCVGTSGVVYPAAGLAQLAGSAGAYLVEINPERTELSSIFDTVLRGPSGKILPAIGRALGIPTAALTD